MKNCECWQQPDMAATLAGKKITNKASTSLSLKILLFHACEMYSGLEGSVLSIATLQTNPHAAQRKWDRTDHSLCNFKNIPSVPYFIRILMVKIIFFPHLFHISSIFQMLSTCFPGISASTPPFCCGFFRPPQLSGIRASKAKEARWSSMRRSESKASSTTWTSVPCGHGDTPLRWTMGQRFLVSSCGL